MEPWALLLGLGALSHTYPSVLRGPQKKTWRARGYTEPKAKDGQHPRAKTLKKARSLHWQPTDPKAGL